MSAIEASSGTFNTMPDVTLYTRLMSRVVKNDSGCLEWSGCRLPNGYGGIQVSGKKHTTHRAMWEAVNGPIPTGLYVCHRCDNPPCINVEHLFLGTAADNARDRSEKGRSATWRRGELNSASKFSDAEVAAAVARIVSGERAIDVAKDIGACAATMRLWQKRLGVPLTGPRGSRNGRAKLRESDIGPIQKRLADGESQMSISRDYGVSGYSIWRIANGVSSWTR